ncbi:MAG: dephospho-CoA kinase [Firmicutes bacterium]|nr:dephospho-CoA kinase [Bacillota bacterium]MCM1401411.1 dephospho-CoA kinase [Bacteroides sp.]MCM1477319.1 dephospho-CoA kinase [Bacteroides sp.]
MKRIIAITGGIGSGKSVVRKMVEAMGFPVYDCDSRARKLMESDIGMIGRIGAEVCAEAVIDNVTIDRCRLGNAVFGNPELLSRLNSIVHGAVKTDVQQWIAGKNVAFIETAILYTSGLNQLVNEVWEVIAPVELRVIRVANRNPQLSEADIRKRIDSQQSESNFNERVAPTFEIVNDGFIPLLPQVESLIDKI